MNSNRFPYPSTPTVDVVDHYHGTAVTDPYRWLEDPHSAETQAWVAAQNALTQSVLAEIPLRAEFQERLTALWNFPKSSALTQKGGRYFVQKNDGLQNQSVLYWQASP